MKIEEQKINEFIKDLGSSKPTPGGGVVAALSGVMAASLIEMVCELTLGKKGYEHNEEAVKKIQKNVLTIKKRLMVLSDADSKAFEKVLSAYKKSKDDPTRKVSIRKALKYAIEVPMEVKKLTQELEKLALHIAKIGNKNALSDAKSAMHIAIAAGKAAQENIKINKESLRKIN